MNNIPKKYRGVFKRAKTSRATAVKAKCLDCCNFYRSEITNCQIVNCPLWPHRPYQKGVSLRFNRRKTSNNQI